jgi:hypothetical protein
MSSKTFSPLGPGVMPIGAWVCPPSAGKHGDNPSYITDEHIRNIAESGLNLVYGFWDAIPDDAKPVREMLDLCQKYGLKYLVNSSHHGFGKTPEEIRRALAGIADHPAWGGQFVCDEPGRSRFEELAAPRPAFEELYPDKYYYINLPPLNWNHKWLWYGVGFNTDGWKDKNPPRQISYEEYLNEYCRILQPRFLSYDNYQLPADPEVASPEHFENMSIMRRVALAHGIPYWNFVQMGPGGRDVYARNGEWLGRLDRVPLQEADVRWMVNTALSYGVQGIQYFCYWTPEDNATPYNPEKPDEPRMHMITRDGHPTRNYYYVQRINRQVAAVAETLMNCVHRGLMLCGSAVNNTVIPHADLIEAHGSLNKVTAHGAGFLTGCFDHGEKSAYYVTNNTLTDDGAVTLHFAKPAGGAWIADAQAHEFTGTELTLQLKRGEGALVCC